MNQDEINTWQRIPGFAPNTYEVQYFAEASANWITVGRDLSHSEATHRLGIRTKDKPLTRWRMVLVLDGNQGE